LRRASPLRWRKGSASQLSAALEIPKSSLFHLIGTLIDRRYIEDAGGGRYCLGPRLREIVNATEPEQNLARLMEPILQEFTNAIKETAGFSVERGDEVEVIGTQIGSHSLTFTMSRGDLAPLYAVSAGKGTDRLARIVTEYVSAESGQPFVVQNKPRAGGTIAAAQAARSKPDGYTAYMMATGYTIAAAVYKELRYDAENDFDESGGHLPNHSQDCGNRAMLSGMRKSFSPRKRDAGVFRSSSRHQLRVRSLFTGRIQVVVATL
jgi:hypothetical protein